MNYNFRWFLTLISSWVTYTNNLPLNSQDFSNRRWHCILQGFCRWWWHDYGNCFKDSGTCTAGPAIIFDCLDSTSQLPYTMKFLICRVLPSLIVGIFASSLRVTSMASVPSATLKFKIEPFSPFALVKVARFDGCCFNQSIGIWKGISWLHFLQLCQSFVQHLKYRNKLRVLKNVYRYLI